MPIWILCLGLCLGIVYLTSQPTISIELESSLCLILNPTRSIWNRKREWYVQLSVVILNLMCMTISFCCFILLAITVWNVSYGAIAKSSTKRSSPAGLIKLALLTVSTLATYVPMIVLYIITLLGYHAPSSLLSLTLSSRIPDSYTSPVKKQP